MYSSFSEVSFIYDHILFDSENVRIARLFNTYGPRMRANDGRAVPNFISQALNGDNITVYGDGTQTRSLCYVDDTVEGIYKLASYTNSLSTSSSTIENISDPIVMNIGNPLEMTVLDIAKSIKDITDSKSEIVFKPLPTHDPKVRRPDIGLAQSLLGWHPKIDYVTGIKNTLEYFKTQLIEK